MQGKVEEMSRALSLLCWSYCNTCLAQPAGHSKPWLANQCKHVRVLAWSLCYWMLMEKWHKLGMIIPKRRKELEYQGSYK